MITGSLLEYLLNGLLLIHFENGGMAEVVGPYDHCRSFQLKYSLLSSKRSHSLTYIQQRTDFEHVSCYTSSLFLFSLPEVRGGEAVCSPGERCWSRELLYYLILSFGKHI